MISAVSPERSGLDSTFDSFPGAQFALPRCEEKDVLLRLF